MQNGVGEGADVGVGWLVGVLVGFTVGIGGTPTVTSPARYHTVDDDPVCQLP